MKATMELPPTSQSAPNDGVLVQLTLDQIALDPATDVRNGPADKEEASKIDLLAKSIYEEGQLQPIMVRPNGQDGKYLLIAGRRRLAAVKVLGERISDPNVTVNALVVNKNDDEAWSASLQENLQRRQFSPLELANNIIEIKKRKGWDGSDWTARVADFLKVSRATVSQHAKLLALPKDIQAKVHKGIISAQSAFDLHEVQEAQGAAKAAEVAKRAEELAELESTEEKKSSKPAKVKSAKNAPEATEEKGKVKRKHILAAAREAEATVKPRTRNEILAFFNTVLESTDPYPDPIVDFCRTLTGKWATGQVGDRSMFNKLNAISDLIADKAPKRNVKVKIPA